jgi:hypothetical protein
VESRTNVFTPLRGISDVQSLVMILAILAVTTAAPEVNNNLMALEATIPKTLTGPAALVNTALTTHLTVLLAAKVAD